MNNVLTINERKFLKEAYNHLPDVSYMESMENYIQEGIVSKILQNIAKKARNNHLVYGSEKYINMFIKPYYGDLTKAYKAILKHITALKKNYNVMYDQSEKIRQLHEKYDKFIKSYKSLSQKLYNVKNLTPRRWKAIRQKYEKIGLKRIPKNYKIAEKIAEKYEKYVKNMDEARKKIVNAMADIKKKVVDLEKLKNIFKNSVKDKVHIISTISHKISNIRNGFISMFIKMGEHLNRAAAAVTVGAATAAGGKYIYLKKKTKNKQKVIIEKLQKYEQAAKQALAKKDYRSAIRNYMNSLKIVIPDVISRLNVPTSVKKAMRTTSGKAMAVAGSIAILAVGYSLVKMISRPLIALVMKILDGVASAIKAGKAVVTSLFQNAFRIAKKIIANFKSKFK